MKTEYTRKCTYSRISRIVTWSDTGETQSIGKSVVQFARFCAQSADNNVEVLIVP